MIIWCSALRTSVGHLNSISGLQLDKSYNIGSCFSGEFLLHIDQGQDIGGSKENKWHEDSFFICGYKAF
jgi:hypothetical protein